MRKFLIKTDNGTFELAVHKRYKDNSAEEHIKSLSEVLDYCSKKTMGLVSSNFSDVQCQGGCVPGDPNLCEILQ